MSARKHRNTWWVDFAFGGVRYRLRSPVNTRLGADAYEQRLRMDLATGKHGARRPGREARYAEFVERWLREYVVPTNKPSEQGAKRLVLKKHLLPAFGSLPLSAITAARIEEFKAKKLATGLAKKTVNNFLLVLSRSLAIAEEWSELAHRPKIRLLRLPPLAVDFLTVEESETLLASISDPFWHSAVLLALRTGLRRGELRALSWPDVDLEKGQLVVRQNLVQGVLGSPKSNKIRQIPLSAEVCAALRPRLRGSGFVFSRDPGGRPLGAFTMRVALGDLCRKAGLRHIGWHTLRHTFATQLVASGTSLRVVQDLLGHADIHTTMRYAHVEPAQQKQAVERLDSLANEERSRRFARVFEGATVGSVAPGGRSRRAEVPVPARRTTALVPT